METYLKKELRKKYTWDETARGLTRLVRYADDFVILHKNKEVIEDSKRIIKEWLAEIGLELSESKTKITHSSEGFNFLGFNIKHYQKNHEYFMYKNKSLESKRDFKLLIKPSNYPET